MRRGARAVARFGALTATAVVASVLLGGCRPALRFDFDVIERESQIESVAMRVTVTPRGGALITETVTFVDDQGGTVALPGGAALAGDAYQIEVDGRPVAAEPGSTEQLLIEARKAVVTLRISEVVDRYADVAILRLGLLPSSEPSSPSDPPADLTATVALPEGARPDLDDVFLSGDDVAVRIEGGRTLRFSASAPVWFPNDLIVGFDQGAVPDAEQTPLPWRSALATELSARRMAARASSSARASAEGAEKIVETIFTAIAFGLPALMWLFVLLHVLVVGRARRVDVSDVPEHLADPPGSEGPGVVSVLREKGRPARAAVAGELLALAHRRRLRVDESGGRVLVTVPLDTVGEDDMERLLLGALRERTDDRGRVEGPPLWPDNRRFWRYCRRIALREAQAQGLVVRFLPLARVSGAMMATGVGIGLFYFTNPIAYAAIIFGSQIVGAAIGLVGGWRLTERGYRKRALWHSFARYITDHGELHDVGPAGVTTWGPYVVYGTVLGEAPAAAEPLSP